MESWTDIVRRALVSGSIASVVSTAVLMALSRSQGTGAVQPVNATAHWLYGGRAGASNAISGRHTLIGYATNHAAAVFWALLFEAVRARGAGTDPAATAKTAAAVAAVAATVDYGLMPRRLTPGWELVLSKGGVGAGFVALAAGLALGGLLSERESSPFPSLFRAD